MYASRFEPKMGNISDIVEAISAYQKAIELTPSGHANLPHYFRSLGSSYTSKFYCTHKLFDITKAISAHKKAIELAPSGHATLRMCFDSIGCSYQYLFCATKNLSDIANSISAHQKAVELTPFGDASLPAFLQGLGDAYQHQFMCTGNIADNDKAISAYQKSVELTPSGHANLSGLLCNLSKALLESLHVKEHTCNQDKAIAYLKTAASLSSASPSNRLMAAKKLARLTFELYPHSPDTIIAFETVMNLLPLVAGLEQTLQHRYIELQDMSDLPLQAAAAACSLGHFDKALEWLEQGRCLVWTQLNHLRTPVDDLFQHDKSLAQQFLDISKRLENAASRGSQIHGGMSLSDKISLEKEAYTHLKLATEWDELLQTIRNTIPGFSNFLQPSPCSALLKGLSDLGPVVIINVDHSRCDAIALTAGMDKPCHIELPKFSWKMANIYQQDFMTHLRENHLRMRGAESELDLLGNPQERGARPHKRIKGVHNMLDGLWRNVVKPILEALGFLVSGFFYLIHQLQILTIAIEV
jgi:tetratricopeptide (TPR) repeat protein